MTNHPQPSIHTERVDDVPLLLAQILRLRLPELLDAHFPAHGNRRGLSLGWLCALWLAHILSRADHRLNRVRPWAEQLQFTLNSFLPAPLRPTDLTDDRLADLLRALSDDLAWAATEAALNQRTLRVYQLPCAIVRLDTTTVSGYWQPSDDGLFRFGHSKDHRPDLPQVKLMLATLDPLGMPLAADVLAGHLADDPLYLPCIERVRASLGQTGLLYVGDSKLGALSTRASLHQAGDHYLCPLGALQLSKASLAEMVELALSTQAPLLAITRQSTPGTELTIAYGLEQPVELSTMLGDEQANWTERRLLVCSVAAREAASRALERRLEEAEAALAELLVARRGKVRPSTPDAATQAVAALLERYGVSEVLEVLVEATPHTRTVRAYRGQERREETSYTLSLRMSRREEALSAAKERLGWRVYATNRPTAQLSLAEAVLAYREEYLVERSFSRLKGVPLSLGPVYLSREDHTVGMFRLLSLGLRVLTVMEQAIRQELAKTQETLAGLYAGQPSRSTSRPSAERVLEAFQNLTLTVVHLPGQVLYHLTPLSPLHERLLALAGLDPTYYHRLNRHFSDPPA